MVNKKVSADEQVQRMKTLMNYGINESKQPEYSTVEYSKVAADGKLYGIVREGTHYYIKVAKDAKANLVTENFDYIGGFRNRKDNMFESFAAAQRYFCEKLMCINESVDSVQKRVIAESWNLDEKKEVLEERTRNMQKEINRQRQIMSNVQNLNEGKKCDMPGCPKPEQMEAEEPKKNPSAPYTQKLTNKDLRTPDNNIKGKTEPVIESAETPLSSRKNPDYMDKSHGTKIGSNAPFDNNIEDKPEGAVADAEGGEAVHEPETQHVNEETVMHDSQNQNSPEVGVSDKGDNAPFEDEVNINEELDDLDDDISDDEVDIDIEDGDDDIDVDIDDIDDTDAEAEPIDADDTEDIDTEVEVGEEEPVEDEVMPEDGDLSARMDSLEAKLDSILDAIQNMKYDDDEELYDDDEIEDNEDEIEDDDTTVYESKSFKEWKKKMIKEDSDFGKHPAYQKKVMTTPPTNMAPDEGDYDMNDSSVEVDKPFGISKGNQAPYSDNVEAIENAITEAVVKMLKKKLG